MKQHKNIDRALKEMRLILPWPNSVLNPNKKGHWSVKSKARAKQKSDAYWIALEAGKVPIAETYPIEIIFRPPTSHKRDIDNCLASIKGMLDGIAMAWKINDHQFRIRKLEIDEITENGAVIINLE